MPRTYAVKKASRPLSSSNRSKRKARSQHGSPKQKKKARKHVESSDEVSSETSDLEDDDDEDEDEEPEQEESSEDDIVDFDSSSEDYRSRKSHRSLKKVHTTFFALTNIIDRRTYPKEVPLGALSIS